MTLLISVLNWAFQTKDELVRDLQSDVLLAEVLPTQNQRRERQIDIKEQSMNNKNKWLERSISLLFPFYHISVNTANLI